MINLSKASYYKNKLNNASCNPKKETWGVICDVLGRSKNKSINSNCKEFIVNNVKSTDSINSFNKHFIHVGECHRT